MNVTDTESRPVLVPADNKSKPSVTRKLESKSTRNAKVTAEKKAPSPSPPPPPVRATSRLRRQEQLLRMNLSLNASCSSDASTDSFQSRASTGRIPRKIPANRKKQFVPKVDKVVPDSILGSPVGGFLSKSRCAWVTPNTDPCYAVFHDEEWGVPVHDDKKLFELLMLSGALAELTWPAILGKRHIFREVFADFDPSLVCKLNEKKILAPGSPAGSLLSEPKLRAIIDNAHLVMKIIEEFGSFDKYCWNFVNNKPILNKFRYSREVPVKTPKAEVLSKDMVRRGFRSVSPTVIYSFMQAAGLTNDHLVSCYRYNECNSKFEEMIEEEMKPILEEKKLNEVGTLGLLKSVEALNIS